MLRDHSGICQRTELDQEPATACPFPSVAGLNRARRWISEHVVLSRSE
jgi:hypothetical protein